jgi:aminoglycoside 3-N-acetyltransferase
MPAEPVLSTRSPVTRGRLAADLRALGLRDGAVAMAHCSMSSLGWVVGGSQTVVAALLDCLGPAGTLCAQASWEDAPVGVDGWPARWRRAYAEMPPFDPELSAAAPYEGRIPERMRGWPGARRSANPATGIVAIGRDAVPLTADHRLDDGFGPGTPYARIAAAGGQVVLLGAPLHTISLLHHAESIARGAKRWTTYRAPLADRGWVEIRELDVWRGAFPYTIERPLAQIARDALGAGAGRAGTVGSARAYLFEAAELTAFAVRWLECRWPAGTRG